MLFLQIICLLNYCAYLLQLLLFEVVGCCALLLKLCTLALLQHYSKAPNAMQRAYLVEEAWKKTQERMRLLSDV
ncbi:hypothetical protein QVD17_41891 [Tagetes erecta]|uniref:Uncharacterized protein n=1 Tax=Tagetes erecta TaxID=13708 RepID=A0AAD8JPV3_TARER|nr:hypothetical protein QVD17_41891 [Tagetes erecta]